MTDKAVHFTVRVTEDPQNPGHWLSNAFGLPGARVIQWLDANDGPVSGIKWSELSGFRLVGTTPAAAVVEVPAGLALPSSLEKDKLALEELKLQLEERNRKRLWLWGIGGAILSSIVTLAVAYMGSSGGSKSTPSPVLPFDLVSSCRDSLQRLPLLSKSSGQTLDSLSQAIERHVRQCDELLVQAMSRK